MAKAIETAEALIAEAQGRTIAYECGQRYPCFKGASRAELAEIFRRHGFTFSFDVTAENCLSEAVGRYGRATVAKHKPKDATLSITDVPVEAGHARAWLVERVEKKAGERQPVRIPGARVFVSGDDVYAAPPVDGHPEIPECAAVAKELAAIAVWLQTTADNSVLSRAMTSAAGAYAEAGAFPWISRGTYVAAAGRPGTERLVALILELRQRYYDPATRCGVRVSAVPIKSGEEQSVQALVDAVLDEVARDVDSLVKKCKDESGRGNVRASTFGKRRDEARAVLDKVAQFEGLMGEWGERFRKAAGDVADAYNAAVDGQALVLPDWVDDYSAASRDDGDGEAIALPTAPVEAEPELPSEPDPFAI